MEPSAVAKGVAIHISTGFIAVVCLFLFKQLWSLRKDKVFGSLCLFFLSISMLYILVLLLRFPTEEINLVKVTGIVIPFVLFIFNGLIPLFGSSFSIFNLFPQGKTRSFAIGVLTCITLGFFVLLAISHPTFERGEWVLGKYTKKYFPVMIIMMFIPSLLYLLTLLKSKGKEERISNSMLFVGMLMIALLVMVSESYGVFPPIIARRFLVCLAVILIYSGLLMPGWVRRLFHLE